MDYVFGLKRGWHVHARKELWLVVCMKHLFTKSSHQCGFSTKRQSSCKPLQNTLLSQKLPKWEGKKTKQKKIRAAVKTKSGWFGKKKKGFQQGTHCCSYKINFITAGKKSALLSNILTVEKSPAGSQHEFFSADTKSFKKCTFYKQMFLIFCHHKSFFCANR